MAQNKFARLSLDEFKEKAAIYHRNNRRIVICVRTDDGADIGYSAIDWQNLGNVAPLYSDGTMAQFMYDNINEAWKAYNKFWIEVNNVSLYAGFQEEDYANSNL